MDVNTTRNQKSISLPSNAERVLNISKTRGIPKRMRKCH